MWQLSPAIGKTEMSEAEMGLVPIWILIVGCIGGPTAGGEYRTIPSPLDVQTDLLHSASNVTGQTSTTTSTHSSALLQRGRPVTSFRLTPAERLGLLDHYQRSSDPDMMGSQNGI
jgi:hypothetical protein